MEYPKIKNLIGDAPNHLCKFKTKNLVEINDESRETYNVNSQIKFKTTMLKSSLCDYSDAYILAKGTITVNNTVAADADANNTDKKVIFKNCALFTNCISKINNTQVHNVKDIDIVMPMYNLIDFVDNNNAIVKFAESNLADSFNFKVKMTGQTGNDQTKNVEIMVPLKYLRNFWRASEMPLTNCEIDLILTCSVNCFIVSINVANQNATF